MSNHVSSSGVLEVMIIRQVSTYAVNKLTAYIYI